VLSQQSHAVKFSRHNNDIHCNRRCQCAAPAAGEITEAVKEFKKLGGRSGGGALRPQDRAVSRGWYRQEGDIIRAELAAPLGMVYRWVMTLVSADGGYHNRLLVLSLSTGPADGGGGDAANAFTPQAHLEGDEFAWQPAPGLTGLTW
jgi:hypothetical protein